MEKQTPSPSTLFAPSRPPPPYSKNKASAVEGLEERLDRVQLERIQKLTETHIDGLVNKQLAAGLSKGVFAFIPSDVSLLQTQSDGHSIGDSLLGFSEGEFPYMIRLEDEGDTSEFWKQPRVIQKLEQVLKSQLRIKAGATGPSQPVGVESTASKTSTFWGFMRRQSKPEQPGPKQTELFSQSGAGWKAEDDIKTGSPSTSSLRVAFEEVTVRIQSDLGLYQTRSCPAVVVRLVLGI